ncbi:sulfurtransferase [Geobacter sp. FeAm09]|uniref:sulfurtransferase n=1 Tax=Geobacter sp. FeAm09 TaxID=2597769 RepID=UPI0011F08936|nr:rhodanese-like domain-containing protein [Geobacter sp. FeAm09]QEM69486.1 sulfurtransferase [Geobacter sp. FeAm09]
MKQIWGMFVLVILGAVLLSGCGSSSGSKVSAVPTLSAAMSDYPNAGLLVSAASLQNSLGAKKLIVIDTRAAATYAASHIPGAINLNWADYRDGSAMALKPLATLQQQLGAAGISRDATIVIYDDTINSWGAAGRIFWMLDYLGCDDIHILNGGWDTWSADKRPVQAGAVTLAAATFTAATNLRTDISALKTHIENRLGNSDFVVLDTRTDEEYMGWQLYGEARPGHITGSVNIPYARFYNTDGSTLDYKNLKALFESKGITSDKEVVAHCTSGIRSAYAYFLMRLMGYSRCANYDGSIKEWAATSPDLPMEYAANYKQVVYPGWVQTLISGGTPATFPSGNNYQIFECSWGTTSAAYSAGHIPGAIHFNTNNVEARNYLDLTAAFPVTDANEIVWDLVPDSLLEARLAAMGVSNTTTVIVYGADAIAVTRVYWALRYAGVDVRFLNGGLGYWTANGGATETAAHSATAASFTINPQSGLKALTPEIKTYADYYRSNGTLAAGKVLVDVRGIQEYTGEITGYSDANLTRKGRIPGAVWGYDADSSSGYYLDSDSTLRSYTEVRDMWSAKGITADKTVIFYCGTGWRSTLSFLYADLMGWPNIKNYDSWYVWSTFYELATGTIHRDAPFNDSNMPIDTGWSLLTAL